jgi:hypothetical protein
MNWDIFSTVGYVGVALLLTLPLLWIVHWFRRPRRWLCHLAVVIAVAAFVLAKINSVTYVNRIEIDRSEQIASVAAAIEKDRKRRESERAEDVADFRFAEDGRDDFLDPGGMNEGEKAYYEGRGARNSQPDWKRQKVKREFSADNSLENAIGGVEEKEGMDTSTIEKSLPDPIVMSAEDYDLANRLDALHLRFARWAILFGLAFVLVDYLRRFNCYADAYLPLPLPDVWVRAVSPAPAVRVRPEKPRRGMLAELNMLIRQGATFICLTDDETLADSVPEILYRWPRRRGPMEVLPVVFDGIPLSADFVFESLWFGRTAFVETDRDRTDEMLARFSELLAEREVNGARARQPVVLVWHRAEPVPEIFEENMRVLGPATGVSLFVCQPG